MEINYNLTEDDYLNFNLFHIKNSKTALKALQTQRFLGPLIFLIASFVFSKMGGMSFYGSIVTFLIISILWYLFYPKYFYSHVIRHTKKMIKEGKNDGLIGKHCMILTEEGIGDTTLNGETKVSWSGIKDFKEDHNYFFLYNSAVSAYILPKRDLENVEELRNFIKSQIC